MVMSMHTEPTIGKRSTYEHERPARHAAVEAVGVACRDHGDRGGSIGDGVQAIPGALARTDALHMDDTAME